MKKTYKEMLLKVTLRIKITNKLSLSKSSTRKIVSPKFPYILQLNVEEKR